MVFIIQQRRKHMDYNEELHQQDLQRLRGLRLIDDDFMTACFDNYIEGAQLLLNIILDRNDLTVTEVRAQKVMKNLCGRDVWLDIYAMDTNCIRYNVEVQRADKGADRKRARYHSSIMDADMLKAGEDYSMIDESYVIFITENDVLGWGLPVYHVERHIDECNFLPFDDGEHIIYVNGELRPSNTALGKLMIDFFCTDANNMNYKELSDRVRFYKETEKGVNTMCKAMDDMRNDVRIENARKMIDSGKLSLEDIAEFSGLSIEKIRELAGNKTA